MISSQLKRPLGTLLILLGLVGIVAGGFGIYQIWQLRTRVETSTMSVLTTTLDALDTTQLAITTLSDSLETIDGNITTVNDTLLTVAQSLNDAGPIVDSISTLLQDELPTTLAATQTSLETAEASAKLLDSVMRALTSIPFYPGEKYNPPVPLDVAVKNVAVSLEDMPESLIEVGVELSNNQDNFSKMEDDLIALSVTLSGVNENISDTKVVLSDYQILLETTETKFEDVEGKLPAFLTSLAWVLSIFIIWIMATQVGLIVQGLVLFETIPANSVEE